MTLDEALAQLVSEFGEQAKAADSTTMHDVMSGGLKAKHSEPEPALYISQELAIKAWLREMQSFLCSKKVCGRLEYKIASGPHLDKWMITTADKTGQHRVSEPRWSVTAKVWIATVEVA